MYLIRQDFAGKDSFFPQINSAFNQRNLLETSVTHNEIRSNTTIRRVFKQAFEAAGHVYLRPHSFRHTIARFAEKQTPEFLNAIRQSLGHSSIDVTLNNYGKLSEQEQRNRISNARFDFKE